MHLKLLFAFISGDDLLLMRIMMITIIMIVLKKTVMQMTRNKTHTGVSGEKKRKEVCPFNKQSLLVEILFATQSMGTLRWNHT